MSLCFMLFCFILWKFEKIQQNPKWIFLLIFLCFYELQNEQQMMQEKQKLLFSFFYSIHCISLFHINYKCHYLIYKFVFLSVLYIE